MTISGCEIRDPRIRHIRQLLQNTLRTSCKGKSFDEIDPLSEDRNRSIESN